MNRTARFFNVIYFVVALLGVWFLQQAWMRSQTVAPIPYSEFQTLLKAGKVEEVSIGQDQLTGKLREPLRGKQRFVTQRVELELSKSLDQHGVKYSAQVESTLIPTLLSWIVPVVLFFGVWLLLMRRLAQSGPGGGLMAIGKSRAKVYVEKDTGVSFDDVAGVEESKGELEEVVAFLKDPQTYGRLGARMPKGVLLVGPPGTGKGEDYARIKGCYAASSTRAV